MYQLNSTMTNPPIKTNRFQREPTCLVCQQALFHIISGGMVQHTRGNPNPTSPWIEHVPKNNDTTSIHPFTHHKIEYVVFYVICACVSAGRPPQTATDATDWGNQLLSQTTTSHAHITYPVSHHGTSLEWHQIESNQIKSKPDKTKNPDTQNSSWTFSWLRFIWELPIQDYTTSLCHGILQCYSH